MTNTRVRAELVTSARPGRCNTLASIGRFGRTPDALQDALHARVGQTRSRRAAAHLARVCGSSERHSRVRAAGDVSRRFGYAAAPEHLGAGLDVFGVARRSGRGVHAPPRALVPAFAARDEGSPPRARRARGAHRVRRHRARSLPRVVLFLLRRRLSRDGPPSALVAEDLPGAWRGRRGRRGGDRVPVPRVLQLPRHRASVRAGVSGQNTRPRARRGRGAGGARPEPPARAPGPARSVPRGGLCRRGPQRPPPRRRRRGVRIRHRRARRGRVAAGDRGAHGVYDDAMWCPHDRAPVARMDTSLASLRAYDEAETTFLWTPYRSSTSWGTARMRSRTERSTRGRARAVMTPPAMAMVRPGRRTRRGSGGRGGRTWRRTCRATASRTATRFSPRSPSRRANAASRACTRSGTARGTTACSRRTARRGCPGPDRTVPRAVREVPLRDCFREPLRGWVPHGEVGRRAPRRRRAGLLGRLEAAQAVFNPDAFIDARTFWRENGLQEGDFAALAAHVLDVDANERGRRRFLLEDALATPASEGGTETAREGRPYPFPSARLSAETEAETRPRVAQAIARLRVQYERGRRGAGGAKAARGGTTGAREATRRRIDATTRRTPRRTRTTPSSRISSRKFQRSTPRTPRTRWGRRGKGSASSVGAVW